MVTMEMLLWVRRRAGQRGPRTLLRYHLGLRVAGIYGGMGLYKFDVKGQQHGDRRNAQVEELCGSRVPDEHVKVLLDFRDERLKG